MKTRMLSMALAGSLLFAGQTMATDLLQDDDLDRLSAAGDPVVIDAGNANGTSNVAYLEDSQFNLIFDQPHAQLGLRALTIQNVVGELQLSVNLNVLSASQNVAGTDQRNFSLQSWGSTLPDADTIKTATATASANAACSVAYACAAQGGTASGGAGAVGAVGASGVGGTPTNNNQVTTPSGGTNTANVDNQNNSGTGGAGGNGGSGGAASANAAGNTGIIKGDGAVAATAVVGGSLGKASADVIIRNQCNGSTGGATNACSVAFDNQAAYNLQFKVSEAQKDLSALFISNVVGRAQMALNLNIAAASLNLVPGSGDPFAQPFQNATAVIKQVNTSIQGRGTPFEGSFTTSIIHHNQ